MNNGLQALMKISLQAILIMGTSLCVYAQKLDNVQEGSILAPANVKVDAKLTEWNDTFQAYNKTTQLNYTIANDDKNLYLTIKSTNTANNTKILSAGVNFTINTEGKKKDKDAFVVTFPQVNKTVLRNLFSQLRQKGSGGQPQAPDSAAILEMRKQAIATVKEIKLSGFKDIPDSVISIYNVYGIKGAVNYDEKGNLVYELSLPLKLLGLQAGSPKEFAYNLKVNAIQFSKREGESRGEGGNADGEGRSSSSSRGSYSGGSGSSRGSSSRGGSSRSSSGGSSRGGDSDRGGMDIQSMLTATDFWGKYTLAKK